MSDLCNEIERFGKSIGSVPRYRIVEALLKGRKTVGELVKIVKLSQPAVSQHLKTLRASNLVIDEKRGQEVFYTVDGEYMLELLKNLTAEIKKPKK
ncbi:MAG: helix-turn-helix transcriptional regulator [Patescibacteria group bacterium]|nr:helix-turn-helix domain-containing protein [Patescibacteria group bacterium]MDE2015674.1 helix-turn-helix transcriptional regulator [Patescibacteria group bacterium]MDE2226731.1 helix-turn-helix transcriptional regulator [Patescibacteria group bacterium]